MATSWARYRAVKSSQKRVYGSFFQVSRASPAVETIDALLTIDCAKADGFEVGGTRPEKSSDE
jgi:hypothetical protein